MEVQHDPNDRFDEHVAEALRVLRLPVEVSGLHWHPFGVYAIPLAKREVDGRLWSRRLHIWHPAGTPVGEASPYGVHTHSGMARSHVLHGALEHHLYWFDADRDGVWHRAELGEDQGMASLQDHVYAPTKAGSTHTLPQDHPHGVMRPGGLSISLFEQLDGPKAQLFTTWQRTDVPPEELVLRAPVPVDQVARDASTALARQQYDS